ncbi:Multiple antibiotic resistance protein MarR [Actinomadura rubteroloni]|uniref:Multiple antibiotic resistance protein MarR n=1 Tax=Actinomadura rubteroloni TaxID=1926885 RepID=A0A2P4UL89_9ACTN|nr:MarR family winged helix-turn-helix transcriptional regulator [Actinomadura rubteroloni]POM25814.1 Multiple antibiotic resistance protein MarR [Actinomadura rubteroloni]
MPDDMPARSGSARLRALPTRLVGHVSAVADRLVTDGFATADARRWHYAVLTALRETGPVSQAELSRVSGIYRSDLVAVLNELSVQGYVERAPDPSDRRRNVITITPAGWDRVRRLDALIDGVQDELLAPLDAAERAQLKNLLERLYEHHFPAR